ncbi:host attachment family protein [Phaeovulum sp. NW3]|jgi:protein required for attachment to host cells|uniref:host attachment family protein n=1 Tax=Phaeovulum sp. NW3 TaxID=2934933 RepID=UPI00201FEFA2|nr:host attachment family protein [Phaeovulum sp. NW3]MCL7465817.1 host attachment family protein [Phaeovulum sp. NW3]
MLLPKGAWVVVADGEKALVLENTGAPGAPKLAMIARDEADPVIIASDRPGRMPDEGAGQRSALEQPDYARLNAERFAGDLVDMLRDRLRRGKFDKVVLVAPPQVLGALRDEMDEGLARHVLAEIHKTLTNHPVPKIAEIVAAELDGM